MWAKSACLTDVVLGRRTFSALDYTVTARNRTSLGHATSLTSVQTNGGKLHKALYFYTPGNTMPAC